MPHLLVHFVQRFVGYLQWLRNCGKLGGRPGQGIGQEIVHADHRNAPARYQANRRQGGVHHGDAASTGVRQVIYVLHAARHTRRRRRRRLQLPTSICIWLNNCRIIQPGGQTSSGHLEPGPDLRVFSCDGRWKYICKFNVLTKLLSFCFAF